MYNKDLQYQIAVMQSYADGNTVQFKKNCIDAAWDGYLDLSHGNHTFNWLDNHYRVKPIIKESVGYRRFLVRSSDSDRVYMSYVLEGYDPSHVADLSTFVRWIDTDWQYHEYEE